CVDILSLCVLPVHAYILSRNNKGRWTKDEHERFLSVAGQLVKSKENWKWISQVVVTTRSPAQVRTHAQKYFRKIGQGLPFPDEGGQDSRLDPHVAAAAASAAATETAAGAAALGHDLDGGMFLPSGGGGASSTLPPLWGDASVAYAGGASGGGSFSMTDDSGGGFPLDNW
ncbi:unnamed protein product, partial [Ectocarpus fasciculatus]